MISDRDATRLGQRMAATLGLDVDALNAGHADWVTFGTACHQAMNHRPAPLALPVDLLPSLPPHTPTAGAGGAVVASPVPPPEQVGVSTRVLSLDRLLGAPVVRTRGFRVLLGAGLLVALGATLGWLALAALASMSATTLGALWVVRQ